jgi:hypothetical protein
MINRSEIPRMAEPGVVLEMSIDIRQSTAIQDNKGKCPRCSHVNFDATVINTWIEWKVHLKYKQGEN